jgi:hypothetical protein
MSRPKFYFQGYDRESRIFGYKFYRSEFDLDELAKRYMVINDEVEYGVQHPETLYLCESGCFMYNSWCEYMPVCKTGYVSETIFERTVKNDRVSDDPGAE